MVAVVGEERVITVEIGNQQLGGVLKKLIKKEAGYDFPSDKLALYLAKKNGNKVGTGMKANEDDLVRLQEVAIPEDIEKKHLKKELLLKPTSSIEDSFPKDLPKKDAIHVLVDIRGKDHVNVAVANVNSLLYRLGRKLARISVLDYWNLFHMTYHQRMLCLLVQSSNCAVAPSTVIQLLSLQLGHFYCRTLLSRKPR
jgi:hypothetical protein